MDKPLHEPHTDSTVRSGWRPRLLLPAAVIISLSLASCSDRNEGADIRAGGNSAAVTDTKADSAELPQMVTVGQILNNPTLYAGKKVTVSGEVNDVLGPRAFTIGGEEFLPPGEFLIVSRMPFPSTSDQPSDDYLAKDDIVTATGTVRVFVRTEVAREVGDALEGEMFVRWEGRPALVVDTMVSTRRAKPGSTAGRASTTDPPPP